MSHNISFQLACIINLANTAKHHKEYCQQSDCNVSLYQLKQTAELLTHKLINFDEMKEADRLINEMPIV